MASMDKIPPNAAPRADVESMRKRVERLGMEWVDALHDAGISRATAFRFLNGKASVASLRRLDEWLLRQEQKKRVPTAGTKDAQDAAITQWTELGEKLMKLDPARFRGTLDGLRDLVESLELQHRAIGKMFRATPDHER